MSEAETVQEYESLFARIDAPAPARPAAELAADIEKTFVLVRDHLPTVQLQHLQWEYLALGLVLRATILGREDSSPRLSGFLGYEDGRTFPDPDALSPEMLDYLLVRAGATKNPVVSAHYHDILWEKRRSYPNAIAAIEAYLLSARSFEASDRPHGRLESAVALDHAAHLSLAINDKERVQRVAEETLEYLREQTAAVLEGRDQSHPSGRWVADLAKIILYLRDRLGDAGINGEKLAEVRRAVTALADFNAAAGDNISEQEFLRLATRGAILAGDDEALFDLRVRVGEAYEKQAATRVAGSGASHLAAAGLYEMALGYFERLRNDVRTPEARQTELIVKEGELKHKIREQYKLGGHEMGVLEAQIDIPEKELEGMLAVLLAPSDLLECVRLVAIEGSLLPNLDLAHNLALVAVKEQGLRRHLPLSLLVDDIPVQQVSPIDWGNVAVPGESVANGTTGDDPAATAEAAIVATEWFAAERDRSLVEWIGISAFAVLTPLFSSLRERELNAEILIEYLSGCGFIDEGSLRLISVGFDRYFEGDYVSAIHILVPHLEDLLRGLFETTGMPMISRRRGVNGWQFETNFGDFLRHAEVQKVMPAELREYLRLVLSDPRGWNLRNRIAHGLVRPDECVEPVMAAVLHIFLILGQFRLEYTASAIETTK